MNKTRNSIAALVLSASALVGLAVSEGYRDRTYVPVEGDVPTLGFGSTQGVQVGDTIDPVTALQRVLVDVGRYEGAIKQCVTAPLHQHEYDAFVSLAYNIGPSAFCRSTLVRLLNAGDHEGACDQILRWNKFQGRELRGLTLRREREHKLCIGQ
ncbi:MAG: lysozyme [Gammaproteobacteria bacterium]|nr:lysozyme [Gammaproteobacteria bacterium]MDP2346824.1 lysozyme [Gammaproteobacteria bacterium]